MAQFKQKCVLCKQNMVLMTRYKQFPSCVACEMKKINQPIDDPVFKKLLDIDTQLYEQSSFLRSIKSNYLRFETLTEKQIEAFKKVVEELSKK